MWIFQVAFVFVLVVEMCNCLRFPNAFRFFAIPVKRNVIHISNECVHLCFEFRTHDPDDSTLDMPSRIFPQNWILKKTPISQFRYTNPENPNEYTRLTFFQIRKRIQVLEIILLSHNSNKTAIKFRISTITYFEHIPMVCRSNFRVHAIGTTRPRYTHSRCRRIENLIPSAVVGFCRANGNGPHIHTHIRSAHESIQLSYNYSESRAHHKTHTKSHLFICSFCCSWHFVVFFSFSFAHSSIAAFFRTASTISKHIASDRILSIRHHWTNQRGLDELANGSPLFPENRRKRVFGQTSKGGEKNIVAQTYIR